MSTKPPTTSAPTKKHLARLQREQMWQRYLLIGTIIVIILVVGLVIYGILFQTVLQARQPIATVNDQRITTRAWQDRVKFQRINLINNALTTYQYSQIFTDPSMQASLAGQLQQSKLQLESAVVGNSVVETMIDEIIIRNEAEKRGITVSEAEVQKAIDEAFGYFPDGTPTAQPTEAPVPTSTLNSLQQTLIPPTPTPSPTAVITATQETAPTALPAPTSESPAATPTEVLTPTPIPDTLEESDNYKQVIQQYQLNYNISEATFRRIVFELFEAQLLREKLQEALIAEFDVPTSEQQVWARHILIEDQQIAQVIYEKIKNGENFCQLAAEFSTDTSNKDQCGDLGWFGSGQMTMAFEEAAFALPVGEVSQPVQTEFGYHIIQSLGNEERKLSQSELDTQYATRFDEWLTEIKNNYEITIESERIVARAPTQPAWPAELDSYIQSVSLQQQQIQEQQLATPSPQAP